MSSASLIPLEGIQSRIVVLRGQRVLLDSDLAELYGVPTKRLNEQVKRNAARFPEDFVFRLTKEEVRSIDQVRSQTVTGSAKHRNPNHKAIYTELAELDARVFHNVGLPLAGTPLADGELRGRCGMPQAAALQRRGVSCLPTECETSALSAIIEAIRQLRSASPTFRRAPRPRAPSLLSGAARRARDHLRATRFVTEPVLPENRRRIGFKTA